jgi:hypothetical protein
MHFSIEGSTKLCIEERYTKKAYTYTQPIHTKNWEIRNPKKNQQRAIKYNCVKTYIRFQAALVTATDDGRAHSQKPLFMVEYLHF